MSDEFDKSELELDNEAANEEKKDEKILTDKSAEDSVADNAYVDNSDNEDFEDIDNNDEEDEEDDEDDEDIDASRNSGLKKIGIVSGIIIVAGIIACIVLAANSANRNPDTKVSTEVTTAQIESSTSYETKAESTTASVTEATTEESTEEPTEETVEDTTEESTEETTVETTEETTEETTPDPYEGYDKKRMTVWNHYTNLGVIACPNYLNIRTEPSLNGSVVGILYNLSGVDLMEASEDGQWYHIISNGIEGYINAEFIRTGEEAKQLAYENAFPSVRVIADVLNVRESPNTDSTIITQIISGTLYNVEEETNEEWLKINLSEEISGYVHRDFVVYEYTLLDAFAYEPPAPPEPEVPAINPVRTAIVNTALTYIGGKYVWGGTTLGVGVDCSGFMLKVFEMYGYTLPRTSYWQVDVGTPVAFEDMKPGDLIFYWSNNNGRVGHVALYIGNNQIVHAASEKRGIVVDDYRYMTPYCAKNIIGE